MIKPKSKAERKQLLLQACLALTKLKRTRIKIKVLPRVDSDLWTKRILKSQTANPLTTEQAFKAIHDNKRLFRIYFTPTRELT